MLMLASVEIGAHYTTLEECKLLDLTNINIECSFRISKVMVMVTGECDI